MKAVLKNINLLHPEQKLNEKGIDILLVDGVITKIGKLTKDDTGDAEVFNLSGKYVVPGLFDMHVHLRNRAERTKKLLLQGAMQPPTADLPG